MRLILRQNNQPTELQPVVGKKQSGLSTAYEWLTVLSASKQQRSKRNKDERMYHKRFQQDDEVMYTGDKLIEIRGKRATVVSRVAGTERGVCIDVDGDSYIVDEQQHLAKYVKKERPEGDKAKGPDVQKRRGVGEKGKKRRNQDEDED